MAWRILFVHRRARRQGGVERYVEMVGAALRRRGHDVALATGDREPDMAFVRRVGRHLDAGPELTRLPSVVRTLRPDVVVVHKTERLQPLLGVARWSRLVLMNHDHDLYCQRRHRYLPGSLRVCTRRASLLACAGCGLIVERARGRLLPLRYRPVWHRMADLAAAAALDGVVVASPFMACELVMHGVPVERIHVVPLGVEAHEAPPPPETPHGILFVGQLVRTKGLDLLLHALARLPPTTRLVVAGDGPQRTAWERLARALGVADRVRWVGRVPPEALGALWAGASVGCVPSRWPEPFGLVGIEAMRAARPVVACDVGGVRTWLSPGQTGLLVRPADPEALAEALGTLLDAPALARRLGRAGRARFEATFTLDHHVDRLEAAIARILEGSCASR